MKRKIVIVFFLFLFLFVSQGHAIIKNPIVVAVNASTYTEIRIGATNQSSRPVSFFLESFNSFLIATSVGGANEAVIPANLTINWEVFDSGTTLVFVKTAAGNDNLVVLIGGK